MARASRPLLCDPSAGRVVLQGCLMEPHLLLLSSVQSPILFLVPNHEATGRLAVGPHGFRDSAANRERRDKADSPAREIRPGNLAVLGQCGTRTAGLRLCRAIVHHAPLMRVDGSRRDDASAAKPTFGSRRTGSCGLDRRLISRAQKHRLAGQAGTQRHFPGGKAVRKRCMASVRRRPPPTPPPGLLAPAADYFSRKLGCLLFSEAKDAALPPAAMQP